MRIAPLLLAIAAIGATAAPAFADDPPWYKNVPKDKQKAAYDLFKQGNTHFEQNEYAQAAELYQKAVALWDHPGIRFNLAVSLVNLDRAIDALANINAAMKYGVAGLETPARFKEAQTYKRLLESRIVTFTVNTTQPNVEVMLDGKKLAPNTKIIVEPGTHALVATKPGFDTITKSLTLIGGAVTENIVFSPRQRRMKVVRRFRPWVPWTVVGLGGLVGLAGTGMVAIARTHRSQFESEFANACPDGCALDDPNRAVDWNLRDRATLEYRIGFSAAAVGGGLLLTGLVMVALNQPREVEVGSVMVTATANEVGVRWLGRF